MENANQVLLWDLETVDCLYKLKYHKHRNILLRGQMFSTRGTLPVMSESSFGMYITTWVSPQLQLFTILKCASHVSMAVNSFVIKICWCFLRKTKFAHAMFLHVNFVNGVQCVTIPVMFDRQSFLVQSWLLGQTFCHGYTRYPITHIRLICIHLPPSIPFCSVCLLSGCPPPPLSLSLSLSHSLSLTLTHQ